MEFLIPLLLKDIMTLKFESQYLPERFGDLTDKLNADIGSFNADATDSEAARTKARGEIDVAESEFFGSFEEMVGRIHASLLKELATLPDDEDDPDSVAEDLFEHVKEMLVEQLYDFAGSGIEFEFEFEPIAYSLEFWTPSTC